MELTLNLSEVPARKSKVYIREGLLRTLPRALEERLKGRTVFWVWDENVWELWGRRLADFGWESIPEGRLIPFSASEVNKRLSSVEVLARQLARAGADRHSAVVAVGGGVTGDVAGFLASIYMRGIPHFNVPTTLLAQVDSSIGGKTGVDIPEGKNLIGTFSQPEAIWMDPVFLETLPPEEFRQGMAEVVKTAVLGDEVLWKFLDSHGEDIKRRDPEALVRVISACCIFKARVVEADEKESGLRRMLNLGHTVGHAVERLSSYRVPHGDAVAIGLMAAAEWSARLGMFPSTDLPRLERVLAFWGLPTRLPEAYSPDAVLEALKTDKKRMGAKLHFILPISIGKAVDRDDLDMQGLRDVLVALRG